MADQKYMTPNSGANNEQQNKNKNENTCKTLSFSIYDPHFSHFRFVAKKVKRRYIQLAYNF